MKLCACVKIRLAGFLTNYSTCCLFGGSQSWNNEAFHLNQLSNRHGRVFSGVTQTITAGQVSLQRVKKKSHLV